MIHNFDKFNNLVDRRVYMSAEENVLFQTTIFNAITELATRSKKEDIIPAPVFPKHDPLDYALPEAIRIGKRLKEYIQAQTVFQTKYNYFTGMVRFCLQESDVPADVFTRDNHKWFAIALEHFYNKYTENLVVFEWQHSAPNYEYILKNGVIGSLKKISYYKEKYHFEKEKYEFLEGMELICQGLIEWSRKCAAEYNKAAENCTEPLRKQVLTNIAQNCSRVPAYPAENFYQGLQSVLFCFYCLPDSIGTLDRYLYDLYKQDMNSGHMTREEAKLYLQEFFVHLSAFTPYTSKNADRSAECHFAIGGYTEFKEDGFNELSHLIVEALMELDTRRPQISLRWTSKTPYETLRYILDCERKDVNKRIALVNDEPRLKSLVENCGIPFSKAVKYTMVGCNEPAFPGTIYLGGCTVNIARCLTNTLYNRTADIVNTESFEDFYTVFREELRKDIELVFSYSEKFNRMREKDLSMLSNFLLDGCIESATPANRYGCEIKIAGFNLMGLTCVIDSLSIIKQFVFEEKITSLSHLIDVMASDWEKDPILHNRILNEGKFFGNNDSLSDEMARRFTTELYHVSADKRAANDARAIFGSLAGYNPHYACFGQLTPATPDGRRKGEAFMVGSGQINGKDRKGLLPLMKSLAQMDPTHIMTGPIVCNMMIDEKLIREDAYFENVCRMVETYFKLGGIHVQFNYVSKEELLNAKKAPEKYKALKVRVSGFSAPFVKLSDGAQDEIIHRTTKNE